jgi:hypothetical protein
VRACFLKLIQMGNKCCKIGGVEARAASGTVKFGTTGLRLFPTLLANYGFSQGGELRSPAWKRGRLCWRKSNNISDGFVKRPTSSRKFG